MGRSFLATRLIGWIALGVFCQPAIADDHANVLFIAVDDLRDWVSHLEGHPQAKTPNIDRLAKREVSFTRAYCSSPLCNPSRISLLTGITPSRSGVYGNGEKLRDKLPDTVTLMQHFRASGYSARGSGNIFHGRTHGDTNSWDDYFVPQAKRIVAKRDKSLPKSAWTRCGVLSIAATRTCLMARLPVGWLPNWRSPMKNPFSWLAGLPSHICRGTFPGNTSTCILSKASRFPPPWKAI